MTKQGDKQFTPGPWIAALGERLNTDVYSLDKQGNRVFIAEFATQADAVLAAAAPAMYAALREAEKHLTDLANYGSEGIPEPLLVSVRSAIAQAEGKQS